MSIMTCDNCTNYVDTDYNVEGMWGTTFYVCESCTDDLVYLGREYGVNSVSSRYKELIANRIEEDKQ